MAATVDRKKLRERLLKLFAMMGATNSNERQIARDRIDELLLANRMSWNDGIELMQTGDEAGDGAGGDGARCCDPDHNEVGEAAAAGPNPVDLLSGVLARFIYFKRPHESVAVALWIMHCFLFKQFMTTPRLALLSPVRGCGKSTVLDVLEQLVPRPAKFDHTTAAGIYHAIDEAQPTLLLDEADNLNLDSQPTIRAVLNSGHKEGGKKRIAGREFATFAPAAFGAIGTLPAPLMARSIVIHMERAPRHVELERFDAKNAEQMEMWKTLFHGLFLWSRRVTLERDPPMPAQLHNRRADNWRPLLAIADACGRGELARKTALAISREHQDEDPVVELLTDIRSIFDRLRVDRLPGKVLVCELHELEGAVWSEWRGVHGDQQPRQLSQPQLATLLRPFRISPKSIWPTGPRLPGIKSAKGYSRDQFEAAWSSYCSDGKDGTEEGTAAQGRNIRRLATG